MMADRHKNRPKAVRMPDGLLGWYETYAAAQDSSVNSALVAALEEFRSRHDGATTAPVPAVRGATAVSPPPKRTRTPRGDTAPAVMFTAPLDSPNARIALTGRDEQPQPPRRAHAPTCKCGICKPTKGTRT
jgi:hypothetical protein